MQWSVYDAASVMRRKTRFDVFGRCRLTLVQSVSESTVGRVTGSLTCIK